METRLTYGRRPPKGGKEHIALDVQVERSLRAAPASRVQEVGFPAIVPEERAETLPHLVMI